jgi:hypothetical protein
MMALTAMDKLLFWLGYRSSAESAGSIVVGTLIAALMIGGTFCCWSAKNYEGLSRR